MSVYWFLPASPSVTAVSLTAADAEVPFRAALIVELASSLFRICDDCIHA
jgi:hypothetical protein